MTESRSPLAPSRRGVVRGAALIAGAGLALGAAVAAPAKLAQKTVQYQDTPKGRARCDGCAQWRPPAACQIVVGVISPSGWCSVFAPKV